MDPGTRKRLTTTILASVPKLFAVADPTYLPALSRGVLVAALENELRFLGLYSYDDNATRAEIQTIVEQHVDHWRQVYGQAQPGLAAAVKSW